MWKVANFQLWGRLFNLRPIGNRPSGRSSGTCPKSLTLFFFACRQIRGLLETDGKLREDWDKLIRKLSE